jgi:hypothetical protein
MIFFRRCSTFVEGGLNGALDHCCPGIANVPPLVQALTMNSEILKRRDFVRILDDVKIRSLAPSRFTTR